MNKWRKALLVGLVLSIILICSLMTKPMILPARMATARNMDLLSNDISIKVQSFGPDILPAGYLPYLKAKYSSQVDGWDRAYTIKLSTDHSAILLISAGEDGIVDTGDDVIRKIALKPK